MANANKNQGVSDVVHDRYAAVARSELSNDMPAVRAVAAAFGYTADELNSLPAEANMGLSCGNPVAVASLRPGEVVVDLGCGGGLDVLLAAKQVGPTGKAIGIDMTTDMVDRARAGAAKTGASNAEFHQARIDDLPLPDQSVDCIISNCVINLVPDKARVFAEMFRVLKPGGRVVISDISLKQALPEQIRSSIEAYVGCIAGAILIGDYREQLEQAGFEAVTVTDTGADLNAYAQAGSDATACCSASPALHGELAEVLSQFDANQYAASVRVHAVKSLDTAPSSSDPSESTLQHDEATKMSAIDVYDKPMCCSTGVCGPQVDPVLPRFAADLDWLKTQGHQVQRFNLAQQPAAFAQNSTVKDVLAKEGTDCLPLILVDGEVVSCGSYPDRERLAELADGRGTSAAKPAAVLPVAGKSGGCCGGGSC